MSRTEQNLVENNDAEAARSCETGAERAQELTPFYPFSQSVLCGIVVYFVEVAPPTAYAQLYTASY